MPKHMLIVNPISGRGTGARVAPEIESILKRLELDYDMAYTEHPLHAIKLTEEAAQNGYDVVVAVGGDGTANEVLNGVVQANQKSTAKKVTMGLLPIGQGNDFAYGLGVPLNLDDACQLLKENYRRSIDVGLVRGGQFPDGRYFGNSVGIGFDAVVGFVALRQKRLHGFLSYLLATLKTIQIGDQEIVKYTLMISIMNGRRLGGGFMMAPEAAMDDGSLDLCIVDQVSRARIATLIPHFLKGTQATQDPVSTVSANQVNVHALEGVLPAHADGETLCTDGDRLEIELIPNGLEIIAPHPAHETAN